MDHSIATPNRAATWPRKNSGHGTVSDVDVIRPRSLPGSRKNSAVVVIDAPSQGTAPPRVPAEHSDEPEASLRPLSSSQPQAQPEVDETKPADMPFRITATVHDIQRYHGEHFAAATTEGVERRVSITVAPAERSPRTAHTRPNSDGARAPVAGTSPPHVSLQPSRDGSGSPTPSAVEVESEVADSSIVSSSKQGEQKLKRSREDDDDGSSGSGSGAGSGTEDSAPIAQPSPTKRVRVLPPLFMSAQPRRAATPPARPASRASSHGSASSSRTVALGTSAQRRMAAPPIPSSVLAAAPVMTGAAVNPSAAAAAGANTEPSANISTNATAGPTRANLAGGPPSPRSDRSDYDPGSPPPTLDVLAANTRAALRTRGPAPGPGPTRTARPSARSPLPRSRSPLPRSRSPSDVEGLLQPRQFRPIPTPTRPAGPVVHQSPPEGAARYGYRAGEPSQVQQFPPLSIVLSGAGESALCKAWSVTPEVFISVREYLENHEQPIARGNATVRPM